MRIASLSTLIAVLSLAAALFPRSSSQTNHTATRHPGSHNREHLFETEEGDQYIYIGGESRRMTNREMQLLLRQEGGEKGLPVDCCPSVQEMVEPEGGRNQVGEYVELYRNGEIRQRFFEKSCRKDVVGKPCRFVDRRLHNQSQCVQQFSYSYAIVRNPEAGPPDGQQRHHHHHHHHYHQPQELTSNLDYIKIRSGCSCEVVPKAKKKRTAENKGKRGKSKRFDEDET